MAKSKKKKPAWQDALFNQAVTLIDQQKQRSRDLYLNTKGQYALDKSQADHQLDTAAPIDRRNIRTDFAGRGMLFGTGYADNLGTYNAELQQKYDANQRTYDRSKNEALQTRQSALQGLAMQQMQARWDAKRRYANSRVAY